jgi:hypothetical protein
MDEVHEKHALVIPLQWAEMLALPKYDSRFRPIKQGAV